MSSTVDIKHAVMLNPEDTHWNHFLNPLPSSLHTFTLLMTLIQLALYWLLLLLFSFFTCTHLYEILVFPLIHRNSSIVWTDVWDVYVDACCHVDDTVWHLIQGRLKEVLVEMRMTVGVWTYRLFILLSGTLSVKHSWVVCVCMCVSESLWEDYSRNRDTKKYRSGERSRIFPIACSKYCP